MTLYPPSLLRPIVSSQNLALGMISEELPAFAEGPFWWTSQLAFMFLYEHEWSTKTRLRQVAVPLPRPLITGGKKIARLLISKLSKKSQQAYRILPHRRHGKMPVMQAIAQLIAKPRGMFREARGDP